MPREDPVKFMLANMARRMPASEMERLGLIPSRSDATIMFSRYPDGTLRLYKPGSIIDDVPAGYSEENVTVKALVKRETEEFMVVIPITRTQLDTPSAEQFLHETAYSHKHRKTEDYGAKEEPIERSLTAGEKKDEITKEKDAELYRRILGRVEHLNFESENLYEQKDSTDDGEITASS